MIPAPFSLTFASTYAIANNGAVYAWGSNELGQLGDGSNADHSPTPVRVGG